MSKFSELVSLLTGSILLVAFILLTTFKFDQEFALTLILGGITVLLFCKKDK